MNGERIPTPVSYEAMHVEAMAIIETIDMMLDGQEPSDFMLTYPIIRKLYDQQLGGLLGASVAVRLRNTGCDPKLDASSTTKAGHRYYPQDCDPPT